MTYFTGDTIRVKVTFRDWAVPPAVGAATDPDEVSVTIYTSDLATLATIENGNARIVNEAVGVYYYDWVLPQTDGTYFIEFKGTYSDAGTQEPCIIRKAVKAKFKPVS